MPVFAVDTQAVADTAARTRTRITTIQTEVDAMNGDVALLQSSWSGGASDSMSTAAADWHDDAVCARFPVTETDPIFYPTSGSYEDTWDEARELCSTCPVIHKCLEEALEFEVSGQSTHGFRAGLAPSERISLIASLRGTKAMAT